MRQSRTTRYASGLIACGLGLALVSGCSDDEPAADTTTPAGPTATTSAGTGTSADPVLLAISTAQTAVPGSQAIAYEVDSTNLDLEVVADDRSYEVYVDPSGTSATQTEAGEVLEAEDRAMVGAIQVPLATAIVTASGQMPGGVVREADLETLSGSVVWDIDIVSGGALFAVRVDVGTGALAGEPLAPVSS